MEHKPKGLGKTEQVTTQWMMVAHRSTMAADVHQEDVVQPTEAAEVGSEVSIVLTIAELPLSLSITPSADVAWGP